MAFKPVDAWLLSFKVNWINWADAVKSVTLRATDPENALAPAAYQIVTAGDWKNQWVFASGLAYNWNELTTIYAGHNYGKNPIPSQNSSPLLAGILEHHITLGAARQITTQWRLTGGRRVYAAGQGELHQSAVRQCRSQERSAIPASHVEPPLVAKKNV
ncbi:OmpP1/FadL family transporter [Methylobacter tundripaludum]|uniref:OmpP1/FadL family transporter n=1 Tax=Methylobacter tundripaludum TaxID=173365 RepID=UPI000AFC3245|nr:hypothetical protein [Methylobacter tundripaludum]